MKNIPQKLQPWIEARKRFHLSHAQVQMGRELGLNPRKFRKYANREQEQWKQPLPQYIEYLYFKRFGKRQPDAVRSVEELAAAQSQKKEVRRSRKQEKRAAGGNAESLPRQQDPRAAGGNAEALSRQSEDEAWLQALLSASEANDDDLALYAESVLDDEDAMSDEDTMDDDGLEDDEYMPAADKRLLRNSLLEAVENQLNAGDPPETRETLQRLMTEGLSEKDAKLHIANVIVTEMWHISRSHEVFNHDRFVRNLRRLPGELEESEEPED